MSQEPKITRLKGKVALVTGSTSGIGFAIARRFAQEGAQVMVSSRKEENVQKAVKKLQSENLDVKGIVCHVGIPEQRSRLVAETVKTFGQLDIVVSNAAVNPHVGDIFDSTSEQWDKLLNVNVKAAFLLVKDAFPHLMKTSGSVLLVTSGGAYVPHEPIGPYCVCKTALLGLVKVLAQRAAKVNVRVNGLAPGLIRTRFSEVIWANIPEGALDRIYLKRIGDPDEISGVAAFLVSDDAKYITSETIIAAGGTDARL